MEKFIVNGQNRLKGDFYPSGNKNEALPAIAACLLVSSTVKLNNIPDIGDIRIMRKILAMLGVSEDVENDTSIAFNSSNLTSFKPNRDLSIKIRASFLLMAPLLFRLGKVLLPAPGGDLIGRRRLDSHFLALQALGAKLEIIGGDYFLSCEKLKGSNIFLDEASVMATENAIMAAVVAEGETMIYNAACEPHVQGLCYMLSSMGAKISGIASNKLLITGVNSLSSTEYRINYDHIEIASIIGMASATHSEIRIKDAAKVDLGLIGLSFERLGVKYQFHNEDLFIPENQELKIKRDDRLRIPKIDDSPWPGFPADLMSIVLIVATQCQGSVLIFEKLFESRLFWVDKIISMGAEVILCDPHRALVSGPSILYADKIVSPDIRAGMALLIAAMIAKGKSEILNIEQIDRGYSKIDEKLNMIGASIRRVKD